MSDTLTGPSLEILSQPDIRRAPFAFRAALRMFLTNWLWGSMTFVLPSGREVRVEGREPGPAARVEIADFRFMRRVMAAGDIGFAEGYLAGEWTTPDLSALLISASLNFDRLARVFNGRGVMRLANSLLHALRPNTRSGAKRNIHAHYDLGNAFYSCWLDPSMTYSSALFEDGAQSLEAAQHAKYAALADSMELRPGQTLLEIGCGWGGFAEYAARERGAVVTAITISREQHAFAQRRMHEAGLADRTDIRLVDYRDVTGRFDRIGSIEMFEAVGERYWPAYFGKIRSLLGSEGRAALQIITIRDELFAHYRTRADFIQRYVFPGGMLISEERLAAACADADLRTLGVRRFGESYARTLAEWSERFRAAWPSIEPLGFDERFRRLWTFYLSYCQAGFATGRTDVLQIGLAPA